MGQGSRHDRSIQQSGYFADNGIVWHADAHLLAVAEYFGQSRSTVQNESERSGQVAFHQFESIVVYFGIFADGSQVVADDGQVVLLRVDAFEAANAFDGAFFQSVATDGVFRVGGIDEQTAVVQQVDNVLQVVGIVVLVVKF